MKKLLSIIVPISIFCSFSAVAAAKSVKYEILSVSKGGFWKWTSQDIIDGATQDAKRELSEKCSAHGGTELGYQYLGSIPTLSGGIQIHQTICRFTLEQ